MTAIGPLAAAAFFIVYLAVQLGIGWWVSRGVERGEDYFLASRNLGLLPAAVSLFATWFGAETLMGSSAAIAKGGMAAARAEPIGFALCLFLMGVLVAGSMRARGYTTLADFFRDRFGRHAEALASVAIMIGSAVWASAQLAALSAILATMFAVPPVVSMSVGLCVILFYTGLSGLKGNVATDVIQALVLLAGLVAVFFAVAGRFGGVAPMVASIRPEQLNLLAADGHWLDRIDAWCIPILGGIATQEALLRLMATRTPADARRACYLASGLYLLIGAIPVTLALAGAHLAPTGWNGDNFLPALVADNLPPVIGLVFLAALVSAILSTVSGNILSISSVLSMNLFGRFFVGATPARQVLVGRMTTLAAGLAAFVVALSGTSIYNLILLSVVLGQGGILVAVLFGLHSRIGGPAAGLAAILANIACNVATLLVYPLVILAQQGGHGGTLIDRLGLIATGEAPAAPGYFLLSLVVSAVAYLGADRWIDRRTTRKTGPVTAITA